MACGRDTAEEWKSLCQENRSDAERRGSLRSHPWRQFCAQLIVSCSVSVCSFVVDANDPKLFPLAQKEMQSLLAQPTLAGVPLLVLLNKNDLPTAVSPEEVVKELSVGTGTRTRMPK